MLKKIWSLFSKKEKNNLIIIVFLMIIGSCLDAIGIGLFIPLLGILSGSENFFSKFFLEIFNNYNIYNFNDQLLILCLIVVLIFLFKFIFNIFLIYKFQKFAFFYEANLVYKIFSGNLLMDYLSLNSKNFSDIIQDILKEINIFSFTFLIPFLKVIAETFVLISITLLILSYNFKIAICVILIVLIFSFLFYFFFSKKYILKWGSDREENDRKRTELISNSLKAFKFIKLYNCEEKILEQLNTLNLKIANSNHLHQTLVLIPTYGLEVISAISLSMVVILIILSGGSSGDIVTITGLFAASAFRVMPAVNRILMSLQTLRFAIPSLDIVKKNLNYIDNSKLKNNHKVITNYLGTNEKIEKIELKNIKFSYDKNVENLKDINLYLEPNNIVGVIGSSGSGKTTLVDIITGLIKPDTGDIKFNNKSIFENTLVWQKNIGYVPQQEMILNTNVYSNVAFGQAQEEINKDLINNILQKLNLSFLIENKKKLGEMGSLLSGGQAQRLGIARALYKKSRFLILDESTSALDIKTEDQILKYLEILIKDKYIDLALIISHRDNTLKFCNTVYELNNGILKKLNR